MTTPKPNKNWIFTINNPEEEEEPPNVWPDVEYVIWQHERGEEGTDHIQGYVVCVGRKSLKYIKEHYNNRAHWEVRRGTHKDAKRYCSKTDTRIAGPWEHGEEPKQGQRNDLAEVDAYLRTHTLEQVADEYPVASIRYGRHLAHHKQLITKHRDWLTDLIIYYGPPRTGKSWHARELWPDAFWLKRGRSGEPWWDGYDAHETVIIDEFYGWISVDTMTRLIDQFPMVVEAKGTTVKFVARRVVIISNKPPSEWWHCELHGMARRLNEAYTYHVTRPLFEGQEYPDDIDLYLPYDIMQTDNTAHVRTFNLPISSQAGVRSSCAPCAHTVYIDPDEDIEDK